MTVLLVIAGAMVGAPLRYLLDRFVQARHDSKFPWGTLCVNVLGSLVLGTISALSLQDGVMALVGTGFCGALTTYSTFGYETVRLAQEGAKPFAVLNVLISVVSGLGAGWLGFLLAQAF